MRVLVALWLLTSIAHADGWYFSEGFGGTNVKDELAKDMPSAVDLRIAVGRRVGHWAVEASETIQLNNRLGDGTSDYEAAPSLLSGGIELKYIQPVSRSVEIYLRGSATIAALDGWDKDYTGRGLGIGAGIQLKGKGSMWGLLFWPAFFLVKSGPKMTGAIWLDDGYEYYRFHGRTSADVINAQLTHITFGYAVGTDF